MKRAARLLFFLGFLFVFAACDKEEESPLAAYRQDLAEVFTNFVGKTTHLLRDDGTKLSILNPQGGLTPDSAYRVIALYTESPDGIVIRGLSSVLSPLPREFREESVRTDPLGLTAMWRGGRYVNLRLALKTGGSAHYLGFIDRDIVRTHDGKLKACIELYHSQNNDPLYYTRETYVSCPVWGYAERLQAGRDSVELSVNTFSGKVIKTFLF